MDCFEKPEGCAPRSIYIYCGARYISSVATSSDYHPPTGLWPPGPTRHRLHVLSSSRCVLFLNFVLFFARLGMKSVGIDVQPYNVPPRDYAVTLNHHRPASSLLPFEQHESFQSQPAHQPAAGLTNSPLLTARSFPPHHGLHMTPLPRERTCMLQTPYSREPSTPAVPASVVGPHMTRIPFTKHIDERRSSIDVAQNHTSDLLDDEYHYNRAEEAKYMSAPSLGPSSHPSPVKSFDFSAQYYPSMVDFQNGTQRRKAVRATQVCPAIEPYLLYPALLQP